MRILIADDEPATRAVVRRILMRHFPCDVAEVDNGLDALDRLADAQHSLLLLDVKMPLMNGVETLRAIRGHARTAHLPVIVMTGSTEEQVVQEVMSLGVSDYVIKPVRPAVIVERVARIAGGLTVAPPAAPRRTRASRVPVRVAPPARVLLADGNPDFVQLFREVAGPDVRLSDAPTGIEALRLHMTEACDTVFVGSDIGLLGHEELARKLRQSPNGHRLALVRVLPPGVPPKRRDLELYDGVIPHSFMAPTLRAALTDLAGEAATARSLTAVLPNIRLIALAAIEDAASQSLGSGVVVKDAPGGTPSQGVEARCAIALAHAELSGLELSLLVSRRSAPVLTSRFTKVDLEAVPPDACTTGVVGTAALVAERIAAGLTASGLTATAAPGVLVDPLATPAGRGAGHAMALQVHTRPAGLTFRITLRGLARGERAAA
ncbi:MAG: response regulator [Vicinamibacterales bacterium]